MAYFEGRRVSLWVTFSAGDDLSASARLDLLCFGFCGLVNKVVDLMKFILRPLRHGTVQFRLLNKEESCGVRVDGTSYLHIVLFVTRPREWTLDFCGVKEVFTRIQLTLLFLTHSRTEYTKVKTKGQQ